MKTLHSGKNVLLKLDGDTPGMNENREKMQEIANMVTLSARSSLELQKQLTAAEDEIAALKRALVEAVIPLEAMVASGTIEDFCLELQQGIHHGIKVVREAIE